MNVNLNFFDLDSILNQFWLQNLYLIWIKSRSQYWFLSFNSWAKSIIFVNHIQLLDKGVEQYESGFQNKNFNYHI